MPPTCAHQRNDGTFMALPALACIAGHGTARGPLAVPALASSRSSYGSTRTSATAHYGIVRALAASVSARSVACSRRPVATGTRLRTCVRWYLRKPTKREGSSSTVAARSRWDGRGADVRAQASRLAFSFGTRGCTVLRNRGTMAMRSQTSGGRSLLPRSEEPGLDGVEMPRRVRDGARGNTG